MIIRNFGLSLMISLISLTAQAHAGHQAFFDFEVIDGQLGLIVKMEQYDLIAVLAEEDPCDETTNITWCAARYIKENFECIINGTASALEMEESKENEGYLMVTFGLNAPEQVETIEVENTCFVNYDPSYENIIRFNFQGESVSYKMTDTRTCISHNFQK